MNKTKLAIALLLSGYATANVYATNGYFAHGYGAKEKGMGGAGVARGQNSISSANNPAGLLDIGDRMDAGFSLFSPVRSYTVEGGPFLPAGMTPVLGMAGPGSAGVPGCDFGNTAPTCAVPFSHATGTVDSGQEWFLIPDFGYSSRIDDQMVWGIAAYGNGGMNSNYDNGGSARLLDPGSNTIVDAPGAFGAGDAGVDLIQLFINTSIAYEVSETVGIGASVIVAIQSFAAKGLAPFGNNTLDSTKLTNNGHDNSSGVGFKFGVNIDLSDEMTVGFSYQSKIDMSEFDEYAGLFAEGGDFDIPSTYTIGLAYSLTDDSTLYLDYQGIAYTDVASISNSIGTLLNPGTCTDSLNNTLINMAPAPATGSGCLGGSDGAGFGWDDVEVIKIGYEWTVGNDTFRVGYSTTDQPIANSELNFNILAPGVVEDHFTAGYTSSDGDNEWTVFVMYAPEVEVTGSSNFDPSQVITIRMNQFEVGFDYKF